MPIKSLQTASGVNSPKTLLEVKNSALREWLKKFSSKFNIDVLLTDGWNDDMAGAEIYFKGKEPSLSMARGKVLGINGILELSDLVKQLKSSVKGVEIEFQQEQQGERYTLLITCESDEG